MAFSTSMFDYQRVFTIIYSSKDPKHPQSGNDCDMYPETKN